MRPVRFLALIAAALLSACAVGPDYRKPATPVPSAYAGAQTVQPATETAAAAQTELSSWWAQFNDPQLSALIVRMLHGNLDLKTAASRVREAREQVIIAGAARLPQLNADADASRLHISQNAGLSQLASLFGGGGSSGASGGSTQSGGLALPGGDLTTYTLGFDASWEIDLFGGVRRSVEAAAAQSEQAVWTARDSEVTLVSEVANDYLLLRALQRQIAVTDEQIRTQEQTLSLVRARRQFGFVTDLDVRQQAAQLATAKSMLPDLDAQKTAQVHALGVLLGEPPEALAAELSPPQELPSRPPAVPLGLPSDLLRRRPDIRAAERALAASSAQIGVAVDDLYPKLDLTGAFDLVSLDLRHLLEGASRQYNATGALSWPIFAGGRIRAHIRAAKEENLQALYAYQKTVLSALGDVENALTRYADEQEKNRALRETVTQTQAGAEIALARYRAGLIDITQVLATQGNLLSARNQLAQSDGTLDRDLVSLYKALGGGWAEAEAR